MKYAGHMNIVIVRIKNNNGCSGWSPVANRRRQATRERPVRDERTWNVVQDCRVATWAGQLVLCARSERRANVGRRRKNTRHRNTAWKNKSTYVRFSKCEFFYRFVTVGTATTGRSVQSALSAGTNGVRTGRSAREQKWKKNNKNNTIFYQTADVVTSAYHGHCAIIRVGAYGMMLCSINKPLAWR